jgi:mannose-6-phosphate isomerase-like protein (cupin superfamily)
MYRVIRSGELQPSPGGTVTFEGEPYGSQVSFFLVNNRPGAGPDLHKHAYSETFIVRSGKVRITADGEDIEAGSGDIVVVGSGTPHKFKNIGTERLDIICIHAAPQMIQEMLDDDETG